MVVAKKLRLVERDRSSPYGSTRASNTYKLRRMCCEKGETVSHIICECGKLAQKEYKRRYNNVVRIVHWEMCKMYDPPRAEQWYNHKPEGVTENESVKVLWDFSVNTDNEIEHRRPDIFVELKPEKECLIIDIAVPGDTRIKQKE